MRKRRLVLLALVAAGMMPGTWVRSALPDPNYRAPVVIDRLAVPRADLGQMTLDEAWQLKSDHSFFGGYSALLRFRDGSFFAGSDSGDRIEFTLEPGSQQKVVRPGLVQSKASDKRDRDLESLAYDEGSGRIWIGLENSNGIVRLGADRQVEKWVTPAIMAGWSENAGPESLVRLANGHFVVLSEGTDDSGFFPGAVFYGDPTLNARAEPIQFNAPAGYRPVDMIQSGRDEVLILVRKVNWGLPPSFAVKIVRASLTGLSNDGSWDGEVVASISGEMFGENYEGMALDDRGGLYLISDDNGSKLQRTLMLRLIWSETPLKR